MTVYLPKGAKTWWYDYRYKGRRYRSSTQQLRREDALLVESQTKLRQRQEAGGIAPFDVDATPRFQEWVGVYFNYQKRFIKRPDLVQRAISVVLEFWGAKPKKPKRQPTGTNTRRGAAPYHDLRLGHPVIDPAWIEKFEAWIDARGVSASTRNTYLSVLSGMYRVAREPQYRAIARVPFNPFREIRRGRRTTRVVALSVDQVKAWMLAAPKHVRIAMAIAALAPKLRLRTILELQWQHHFDQDLTRIVVYEHKTSATSGLPQVTPIDPQLREILLAWRGKAKSGYVVTYHGHRVQSIKKGTKRAAIDAGLTWGVRGVTFHTLRHSIATLLAELGIGERLRMELMGHREIRTTQRYTHLTAAVQVAPHALLSQAMPIKDIVFAPAPLWSLKVYFVRCGVFIKIGVAKNVKKRLWSLSVSAPEGLTLLGAVPIANAQVEAVLHHRFRDSRRHGEWFAETPQLLRFIEHAVRKGRIGALRLRGLRVEAESLGTPDDEVHG